jgi:hypothetical protein
VRSRNSWKGQLKKDDEIRDKIVTIQDKQVLMALPEKTPYSVL